MCKNMHKNGRKILHSSLNMSKFFSTHNFSCKSSGAIEAYLKYFSALKREFKNISLLFKSIIFSVSKFLTSHCCIMQNERSLIITLLPSLPGYLLNRLNKLKKWKNSNILRLFKSYSFNQYLHRSGCSGVSKIAKKCSFLMLQLIINIFGNW